MSYHETIRALKIISTVSLGQFAAASVYGVLAVQPALIEQDDARASAKTMRSLLFKSSVMPVSMLISSASALAVYFKTRGTDMEDIYWLTSGLGMMSLFPYTVMVISPINVQFRDEKDEFSDNDEKWRALLSDWLTFHIPRAALSFVLFAIGVYKLAEK